MLTIAFSLHMKKTLLLFVLSLQLCLSAYAQYDLTITYDATQGVSSLVGASKVYMHSGASDIAGPLDFTSWNYIVGNLTLDDGVGEMTNIGANLWAITFDPVQYYSLAPSGPVTGSAIQRIGMIFRDETGNTFGRDANGQEIYLDLSGSVPAVYNTVGTAFGGVTGVITPAALGNVSSQQVVMNCAPNPLVENTVFHYQLPASSLVSLRVYDIAGRQVAELFNEMQSNGSHIYNWRGVGSDGNSLSNGVYSYTFSSGKNCVKGKLLIAR
jgi:hypothetical protein